MFKLVTSLLLITALAPKIDVSSNWIRPNSKGTNTAVYAKITNKSDKADTLYAVESDLAKVTEIHESFDDNGKTGMRKVDFIVIPAKKTIELKPGGMHIMLIKLNKDIAKGKKYSLTYKFKRAGKVKVSAVASDKAPAKNTKPSKKKK
ncbi:MAG: copper chaperone PCu(A)C [Bacteroidetes bacterium]|nr:copper chaperone PCu(A)C [Bacteroidota bacterium]